jgi:hypothetical protein
LYSGDSQITNEVKIQAKVGLGFLLEDGSMPRLSQPSLAIEGQIIFPESYVVANTRRLLSIDQIFEVNPGRNFSYVPYTIYQLTMV